MGEFDVDYGEGPRPDSAALDDVIASVQAEERAEQERQANSARLKGDIPLSPLTQGPPQPPQAPQPPPQTLPAVPGPSKGAPLRDRAEGLAPTKPAPSIIANTPFGLSDDAAKVADTPVGGGSHVRYQLPGGEWKEYDAGARAPMPDIAPFRNDAVFGQARTPPAGTTAPAGGGPVRVPPPVEDFRPQDKAMPSGYDPGPAVSSPGGSTIDDYLRSRAQDPLELLDLRREMQDRGTALDRGRVGGPAAQATAGEKLQDQRESEKRAAPMRDLQAQLDSRLATNDAWRLKLEAWKAGHGKDIAGNPLPPLSDEEYKRRRAELDDNAQKAQQAFSEGLAFMHPGSAAGFDHFNGR